jgi:hypothetical protein
MSNESFPSVMPHSGSTYHLMCCCPSLLVGTTNTTILLEYLKFGSLMHLKKKKFAAFGGFGGFFQSNVVCLNNQFAIVKTIVSD